MINLRLPWMNFLTGKMIPGWIWLRGTCIPYIRYIYRMFLPGSPRTIELVWAKEPKERRQTKQKLFVQALTGNLQLKY